MDERRLIVGLGNPGGPYEETRHNIGFLAIEAIATQAKARWKDASFTQGRVAELKTESGTAWCLMPLTFVNNSGVAVCDVVAKKGISPEAILVICDDCHLPFGQLRLRAKGSDGGHNGLISIIQHLGTQRFGRLRMGIGRPRQVALKDYVLSPFTRDEKSALPEFIQRACACALMWLSEGFVKTMERFN